MTPSIDPQETEAGAAAYDTIATDYSANAEMRSDRACILVPSSKKYLGDLRGKRVLDLACGSGYFTRLIQDWGAATVVGVDLSGEMVELARQNEQAHPRGIEYCVGDVRSMGVVGEFDVVFAAFLLHYASSIGELNLMCAAICKNLVPSGRFVSLNENPTHPVHAGRLYDVEVTAHGTIEDGTRITRTHFEDGEPKFSFDHFHFERETYEHSLGDAGFLNISWAPFSKGPDADRAFPPGHWDAYTSNFSISVLTCEKASARKTPE